MSPESQNSLRTFNHRLFLSPSTGPSTLISSSQLVLPNHIKNIASPSPKKRVSKSHVEAIKEGVLAELKLAHTRHLVNSLVSRSLTLQELFDIPTVRIAAEEAYLSGSANMSEVRTKSLQIMKNFVRNKLDSRIEEVQVFGSLDIRYRYNPQGKLNVQEIKQGHTLVEIRDNATGKACVVKGSEVAYSVGVELVKMRRKLLGIKVPMEKSIRSSIHAALRCNNGGKSTAHGMTWSLPEAHLNPTIVSFQEAMALFSANSMDSAPLHQAKPRGQLIDYHSSTDVEKSDTEVEGGSEPDTEVEEEEEEEEEDKTNICKMEEMGASGYAIFPDTSNLKPHLKPHLKRKIKNEVETVDEDRTESEDESHIKKSQKPRLTLSPSESEDSSSGSSSEDEEEVEAIPATSKINTGDLFKGTWTL